MVPARDPGRRCRAEVSPEDPVADCARGQRRIERAVRHQAGRNSGVLCRIGQRKIVSQMMPDHIAQEMIREEEMGWQRGGSLHSGSPGRSRKRTTSGQRALMLWLVTLISSDLLLISSNRPGCE